MNRNAVTMRSTLNARGAHDCNELDAFKTGSSAIDRVAGESTAAPASRNYTRMGDATVLPARAGSAAYTSRSIRRFFQNSR
jgi:hypothetical protein